MAIRHPTCVKGRNCKSLFKGRPAHLSQWPFTSKTLCAKCYRAAYGRYPWEGK